MSFTDKRKMLIMLVEPDKIERARIAGIFSLVNEVQRTLPSVQSRATFYYDILECDDPSDAVRLFQVHQPDCIVINCGIDNPTGQEICAEIREIDSEQHVGIIFTAARVEGPRLSIECLESGADDYLKANISSREFFARINSVLRLKAMTDELRNANQQLKILSNTDDLTGMHNMRSFNSRYLSASRRLKKKVHGLGVIMFDLDHFKKVNDTTNHLIGSYVIGEVGRLVLGAAILEESDCAARYGGDEYIIYTQDSSLEETEEKAKRILAAIVNAAFIRDGYRVQVTASIGVAWSPPGYSGKDEDLIKAADMMCFRSKRRGRNQVSKIELKNAAELQELKEQELGSDEELEELNLARLYRV